LVKKQIYCNFATQETKWLNNQQETKQKTKAT